MSETATVRPGQVWADNDARCEGRTVRVDSVDGTYAYCTVLTNSDRRQAELDGEQSAWTIDKRGKPTRITLARMRPTRIGYRLIEDGEG